MKIPTEEEINIQMEELKNHDDCKGDCEFCLLAEEFDKRSTRYADSICWVDAIAKSLSERCKPLDAMTNTFVGGDIIRTLIAISRIAFMVGFKVGIAQKEEEDLERLLGGDNK